MVQFFQYQYQYQYQYLYFFQYQYWYQYFWKANFNINIDINILKLNISITISISIWPIYWFFNIFQYIVPPLWCMHAVVWKVHGYYPKHYVFYKGRRYPTPWRPLLKGLKFCFCTKNRFEPFSRGLQGVGDLLSL